MAAGVPLVLTGLAYAQAVPEGKVGNPDPGQAQRDRTPIDLGTIDKPKPEIEIYTGPDIGGAPPGGIVIVPEERAKTPPAPSPPAEEQPPPPRKKDDYY